MRQIMIGVVQNGTARAKFSGSTVSAGGKTGTAQREERDGKYRIDAWFIGFAPAENPQLAFAVIVEGGGHGGEAAVPIARVIVEKAAKIGLIK